MKCLVHFESSSNEQSFQKKLLTFKMQHPGSSSTFQKINKCIISYDQQTLIEKHMHCFETMFGFEFLFVFVRICLN